MRSNRARLLECLQDDSRRVMTRATDTSTRWHGDPPIRDADDRPQRHGDSVEQAHVVRPPDAVMEVRILN